MNFDETELNLQHGISEFHGGCSKSSRFCFAEKMTIKTAAFLLSSVQMREHSKLLRVGSNPTGVLGLLGPSLLRPCASPRPYAQRPSDNRAGP